jgi:3-hydroxyisobutyrate dehydrogenase-like beta-hydroxyacid dehydrogenase
MAAALSISLVGVGHMGLAIGERLTAAGHPLHVFNRTPGRDAALVAGGASRLDSAGRALVDAEVCVTTLAGDDALLGVLCGDDGILAHARAGSLLIDTTTVSVDASRQVASAAHAAGVDYLRAPFSGNPAAIRSSRAAIFVSGERPAFERAAPLLDELAPTVRYVGEGERARTLKLALQVMIGGTAQLLAEALVLGEAGGVDRATLLGAIGSSAVGSTFVSYKTEPLLRDDFAATFTTAMMAKDVGLVLGLADELGVQLPFTAELRTLLAEACDEGLSEQDFMALIVRLREAAHRQTPIRVGERHG